MHASQFSALLAIASLGLASPVTTSCPYYSELAQFTSEGVSDCASILCSGIIASTLTSTVTGIPTTTVYTTVKASPSPGSSVSLDVVSTSTSTLSIPVTEVSFVYGSTSTGATYAKHRRQEATSTQRIGSCPLITSPAAADASAASAACSCYLTSYPTITRTVTQPPPGQCGPGTVTTTKTYTYTPPASVMTADVTSIVYVNDGPTSYVTKQCTQPSALPDLPYCTTGTGTTQSFGLMLATCEGGPYDLQAVPATNNESMNLLEVFPVQQASQFQGVYYTYPSIFSPTHQELAPWFVNSTHTEVTQGETLNVGDNRLLISQVEFPPASAGDVPGYQCEVNSTDVHPWNCYYDNMPVNWFINVANRRLLTGYGGLADTASNWTQVQPWYVPTCQIQPPTTNE